MGNRRQTGVYKLMVADHKVELINDSVHEFHVLFHGPQNNTLMEYGWSYHGYVCKIRVELPEDYPIDSPFIRFVNKIYHPNVEEISGSICLDILNENWTDKCELSSVFEFLLPHFLLEPNADDPFNIRAAALMKRDQIAYEQKVKEYCERFAKPEDVWPALLEKSSAEEPSEGDDSSSKSKVPPVMRQL